MAERSLAVLCCSGASGVAVNECESRILTASELRPAAEDLVRQGKRFQMAYAVWEGPTVEVRYLIAQGGKRPFLLLKVRGEGELPSLAREVPLLGWYEREMMDLAGVRFLEHPEPWPLIVHEGMSVQPPPLGPEREAESRLAGESGPPTMPEVRADQVQDLIWGPIRGDVLESGEHHYSYIGEGILHYQMRLFYKHRGLERRFHDLLPTQGVPLAERISGVGSVCHALAYCQAVEAALGLEVPPRAAMLRVILAELERLYNHFHYFGHLCKTTTLKVGEAFGTLLEERVKQVNARLTGSRFLRNCLTVGGLRRDLAGEGIGEVIRTIADEGIAYLERLNRTASHQDRLIGTGILPRQTAFDQGATGPVARASGLDRDMRRDHPYAAYDLLHFMVPLHEQGDAQARAQVRMESLRGALDLIVQAAKNLKPGPICAAPLAPADHGEGLGWTESPRGSLYYAVHIRDGRLFRVKIKSPSFSNWRVFPFTVHGSNMMDFAINEASFGLTVAGCDR